MLEKYWFLIAAGELMFPCRHGSINRGIYSKNK